jgi:hypothetical protein
MVGNWFIGTAICTDIDIGECCSCLKTTYCKKEKRKKYPVSGLVSFSLV